MTSLIALYRRRGTTLLLLAGFGLIAILVALFFGFDPGLQMHTLERTDELVLASLTSPFSQGLALLFWITLAVLLGIVWSRTLLRSTDLSEIYLVGALMAAAGFPILYGVVSLILFAVSRLGSMPTFSMSGNAQTYALTGLFLLFLLGVVALIAREAVAAASKPAL